MSELARELELLHRLVDRTLVPSIASYEQLAALDVPHLHLWRRGVSLDLFGPHRRRELLRPGRRARRGPHAVAATGLPAVAYPNRGGTWDAAAKRWAYGDPVDLALVDAWVDAGARFVGGCCCGNGTAEIAALARHLSRR